jgi:hypothetical protein
MACVAPVAGPLWSLADLHTRAAHHWRCTDMAKSQQKARQAKPRPLLSTLSSLHFNLDNLILVQAVCRTQTALWSPADLHTAQVLTTGSDCSSLASKTDNHSTTSLVARVA